MLKGNSLSKGVAIGKIYLLDSSKFCIIKQKLDAEKVGDEIKRFRQAIEKSKKQMQEIKKHASKVGDKYAVILD
ncbi:MAG: phosphoenolpyruvate--protein phosphotransferase, partial [Nitrospinae bacterium]|nr:phosphoenolpyruvate--protein phosphotransferase [Nitrospinota bacterium]